MVEFALALPVLLVLLIGVMEVGRLLFLYSAVASASREAARYGSAAGPTDTGLAHYLDCEGIRAAALRIGGLAGIQNDATGIDIQYDNGNPANNKGSCPVSGIGPAGLALGDRVVVTVRAYYTPIVSLLPLQGFQIRSVAARTILKDVSVGKAAAPPPPVMTIPSVAFPSTMSSEAEDTNCNTSNHLAMRKIWFSLSNPYHSDVTISYSIDWTNSTIDAADVQGLANIGQVTITAGSTEGFLLFDVVCDALNEDDEMISFLIDAVTNGEFGSVQGHTHVIVNDDAEPEIYFTQLEQRATESFGVIKAIVELSQPSGKDVTVEFSTSGTATRDWDYSISPAASLTIPAGSTQSEILIEIKPDSDDTEDDEDILITLENPLHAVFPADGARRHHRAVITNRTVRFDTVGRTITETSGGVKISVLAQRYGGTDQPLSVPFALGGTALPGSGKDYVVTSPAGGVLVFAAGANTAAIELTVLDDLMYELAETVEITLLESEAARLTPYIFTLTINDNDPMPGVSFVRIAQDVAETAGVAQVAVQLSTVAGVNVSVPFSLVPISTTATVDTDFTMPVSPLIIPAGISSATIEVPIADDVTYENAENIVLELGTPVNAVRSAPDRHTITITNDDSMPVVLFEVDNQNGSEAVGSMAVRILLSKVAGIPVTVPYTVAGTAQGSGVDYSITPSPVIIPAGYSSATIYINVVDDRVPEPEERVEVSMGTPTNATKGLPSVHVAYITDNDDDICRSMYSIGEPVIYNGTGNDTVKKISTYILNGSSDVVTIESITISWATRVLNGNPRILLEQVLMANVPIWPNTPTLLPSTAAINSGWTANSRALLAPPPNPDRTDLMFLFRLDGDGKADIDYMRSLRIALSNGCVISKTSQ